MTAKTLSVRELQDERQGAPAEPRASGQIVGIEKPVAVPAEELASAHEVSALD
jgi:hypothetical protein